MMLNFGHRNKVHVDKGNFIELGKVKNLDLKIRGKNNRVHIVDNSDCHICIRIWGDNNTVMIKSDNYLNMKINIGGKGNTGVLNKGTTLIIGEKTSIHGAHFKIMENDSFIKIGKDCMISSGILIWYTDAHSVCDENDRVLNIGKSIEIGNHVWIGMNSCMTKNTKISDNSIVGWNSTVTKKFVETNVIIAGNPAQIVKRNINWQRECPQNLLNKQQKAK